MNNKVTWDIKLPKSANISTTWNNSGNFEKWIKDMNADPPPSEQEMIESISLNAEDVGFFRDILDWLQKMAPKKISFFLRELYLSKSNEWASPKKYSYEKMCELIYRMGFRASETIENRMILGTNNKWVQDYFRDFHPA